MSKKSEQARMLLEKVELPHGVPAPMETGNLLEQGMYVVFLRHFPPARAEAAVQALRKAYEDWNELRVAQDQEIAQHIAGKSARSPDKLRKLLPVTRAARDYLQEVFQKTHALDLAELKEDPVVAGKLVGQMPYLGSVAGSFLLWLAHERELPVTPGLVRVLDRLGLMARTASAKKARAAMDPLAAKVEPLRFATAFGYVAEQWCLVRNPICWECPLREDCPHGRKVVKDWQQQQQRLAVQRQKEEARRAVQEQKEREREERDRKRAEQARQRQQEKDARVAERKKLVERKAVEQRAAQKKKAAAKASAKAPAKATDKDGADKKSAERKGSKAADKKVAKKSPERRAAAKNAPAKKSGTKKAAAKAPARKAGTAPVSAKKASRPAGKSAPRKKPTRR